MRMIELYLARACQEAQAPAVFYMDNHMRHYTGKDTLRKGWRMQDKRAVPGASDYYVHDEDGRPVFRYTAPEHDSLSQWLSPVPRTLGETLGKQQRGRLERPWVSSNGSCWPSTGPGPSQGRWPSCATEASSLSPTSASPT